MFSGHTPANKNMDFLTPILDIFSGASAGTGACLLDLDTLTQILVVAGALNWGTIAFCEEYDLVKIASVAVAQALGSGDKHLAHEIERLIKGLVGVAGVYQLLNLLAPIYGFSVKNYCVLTSA
jgi:uncharacterized membrane protein YuzA (DUF378 family)